MSAWVWSPELNVRHFLQLPTSSFFFNFVHLFTFVEGHVPLHTHRGQRTTCKTVFHLLCVFWDETDVVGLGHEHSFLLGCLSGLSTCFFEIRSPIELELASLPRLAGQ